MAGNRGIVRIGQPGKRGREEKKSDECCEICGREMERDPESGEYSCPDCDYFENEE